MTEKIIKINKIDICTESFGNSASSSLTNYGSHVFNGLLG